MDYQKGLVSVIIPTYKRCETLSRAVESVLEQSYSHIECIVVNDNIPNDDYSKKLYKTIERFLQDKRFVFLEQEKHINGAAARNYGIVNAHGEFISFLDDDDWFEPNKIFLQVEAFSKLTEDWGIVSCLEQYVKNGKVIRVAPPYKSGDIFYEVLSRQIGIGTDAGMIRHSAIDDCGMFDESLSRGQDIQFFSLICSKYKVFLLKRVLCSIDVADSQNRVSGEKLIYAKERMLDSLKPMIEKLKASKQKKVYILNYFEIGMLLFKNGEKKKGIKHIFGILKYPSTFFASLRRVFNRWRFTAFKNHYLKKYKLHS